MGTKPFYDIAFSCAEEDLPVAEHIAISLKKKNISYYLYTEHYAENLGKDLFNVSLDIYKTGCRYVLMLISEVYIQKHWSDLERQMAQTVLRPDDAYIIPIRLDDTPVEGMGRNIIYAKWNNNADELAQMISDKMSHNEFAGEKRPVYRENIVINAKNSPINYGTITSQPINYSGNDSK